MKCSYCERACEISENVTGYCRMYYTEQGTILEKYPDAYLNIYPVSSESIPMLHFHPNGVFLLISTIGCNFACEGCISEFQTIRPGTLQEVLRQHTPEEILAMTLDGGCKGIVFCLNEPTVSFPTFLRVAQAAKKSGLLVGCSTNGYMTRETLQRLVPYLDFANIGLKGATDARYRECGVSSSEPVYRNLQDLHDSGVAVEVSIMYLYGRESEVIGAAERVRAISAGIPFQVMRFMATREELATLAPTREQGEEIYTILRRYLNHVYLFNTLATKGLDSRCPVCGETIIHRVFFGPMAARVLSSRPGGICSCGYRFPCRGEIELVNEKELPVLGGYRSIMGVKFIRGIARALGVDDEQTIDHISNTVIANGYLGTLQERTASIEGYLDMIRYVASLSGYDSQGRRVADYVQEAVADVRARVPRGEKPRVLVVVGHPLYPMYAPKPANLFVELAGGRSLNRELGFRESTDAESTVEEVNRLDPGVILVAGHSTNPVPEFCRTCDELGISCRALSTGRVHWLNTAPGFLPMQMVLSLKETANILYPEAFQYQLADEEEKMIQESGLHSGGEGDGHGIP